MPPSVVQLLALLAASFLAMALGGCSQTNIAEYVKALASDQATVCITLTLSTPWGTQTTRGSRTNVANGNVQCTADGMTVRTDGITIPATVAPVTLTPKP